MSILYYEASDSLKHHGIKGQKWGVRRYQNSDGTLTAAGKQKLKMYKTSEIDKVKKYYAKKDAKYARLEKQTNSTDAKERRKMYKQLAEKEIRSISNMKLSDISKERRAVGAEYVATALSIVGTVAVVGGLGSPIGYIYIPSPRQAKTRYRISEKKTKK